MPTAAISSSIEVAAKPLASTADSATSRMRSRVSLRGVVSSMAHCTMSPVALRRHAAHAAAIRPQRRANALIFQAAQIFARLDHESPSRRHGLPRMVRAISITEQWDRPMPKYRNNLPQLAERPVPHRQRARDHADLQGRDRAQPVRLVRTAQDRERPPAACSTISASTRGPRSMPAWASCWKAPTWRSNADWGAKLGYSPEQLDALNRQSIDLMVQVRDEMETARLADADQRQHRPARRRLCRRHDERRRRRAAARAAGRRPSPRPKPTWSAPSP